MKTRYTALVVLACSAFTLNAQTLLTPAQYDALKAQHLLPSDPVITGDPGTGLPFVPSGNDRSGGGPCDCWIEPDSTYSLAMLPNDDNSSSAIPLPFTFQLFGQSYDTLYINNNGNVSFGASYVTFTSNPFPDSNYVMVAPFWADVDTRGSGCSGSDGGHVWYKLTTTALYVNWDMVGYYGCNVDRHNSFQLIITDGTDPIVPTGNVSFCYHDMQWTTGTASGGVNGFGGTPATVGANLGDGINYAQIGRYDHPGIDYDGPFNNPDGISWLDSTHFYFDVSSNLGVPPIFGSEFNCDTVIVQMNGNDQRDLTASYHLLVLPGGPNQLITCTSAAPSLPNFAAINQGPSHYLDLPFTINATGATPGTHLVTFTATNDAVVPLTSTYVLEVKVSATAGITDPGSLTSLSIAPNPATDQAVITWPANQTPSLIEMIALDGQTIRTIHPQASAGRVTVDLNDLAAGAYTVRTTTTKSIATARLVKMAD